MSSAYTPPRSSLVNFSLQGNYAVPPSGATDFTLGDSGASTGSGLLRVSVRMVSVSAAALGVPSMMSWEKIQLRDHCTVSRWSDAVAQQVSTFILRGKSERVDAALGASWGVPNETDKANAQPWDGLQKRDDPERMAWGMAAPRLAGLASTWNKLTPSDEFIEALWDPGQPPPLIYVPPAQGVNYDPPRSNDVNFMLADKYAVPSSDAVDFMLENSGTHPLPYVVFRQDVYPVEICWGEAQATDDDVGVRWGHGPQYRRPDPPPTTAPWHGSTNEPPPIPTAQRVYIIMNSVTVVRMPDGTPIDVEAADMTASIDSWCWSFRLDLADPTQLALLKPDGNGPKVVQISMNGYAWSGIVEGWDYTRGFPGTGVTVTGRSQTALLSGDYTATRSKSFEDALSAQQLAMREINDRALPYTIDWNGLDWLVPAGAWYYQDLAPIDVIAQIAAARGAVLQSDPGNAALIVQSRYPQSPWAWSAEKADVALPVDWVTQMSSQQQTKPMYDAVIIAGQSQGVLAKVTRQGAAGETFAAQVVDQLIVSADVATERGRNVLGDRGVQELVNMTLPLMPAGSVTAGMSALYSPLLLVDVQDATDPFQGQSAAVTISARRAGDSNKALEIWQQVSLERHRSDAS